MTRPKSNPQTRGRKHLQRGIREQVYLRWRAHFRKRKAEEPKALREQIGKEFVIGNQTWFLELGIFISDYGTLRNVLFAGVAERRARRRASWGILASLPGRFFTANAPYLRHVQTQTLLGRADWAGSPLTGSDLKKD
jgi:hypothetical protein